MKKILLCLSLLVAFLSMEAQYKIKFLLEENALIKHDSIYLTGSFNNWDDNFNKNYLLKKGPDNKHFIVLNLPAGEIQYKYHRGNWTSVEMSADGYETPDHVRMINRDTTLTDKVESWQDQMIPEKMKALAQSIADTDRVKILTALARTYRSREQYYNRDSAFAYAKKASSLLQNLMIADAGNTTYNLYLYDIQEIFASLFHAAGSNPRSLQLRLENLKLAEPMKDKSLLVDALHNVTGDYIVMKDWKNVLVYAKRADSVSNTYKYDNQEYYAYQWNKFAIVTACYNLKMFDTALFYLNQMQALINDPGLHFYYIVMDAMRGDIYAEKKNIDSAFYYYRSAISYASEMKDDAPAAQRGLAKLFKKENKIDSALYYARLSYMNFENKRSALQVTGETIDYWIADLCPLVAELFKANGQMDSAYHYLQLAVSLKDTLYNTDKILQFQTLTFNEASRKQQLELQAKQAQEQFNTKIKMYGLVTGFIVVLIISFILLKNNKQKQKANKLITQQKQKVELTLAELKLTQSQLIQSEKMASLGELTAGIAHEIQNPLNFVNNFSEVNKELVDELQIELKAGNTDEAIAISNDIKNNEEKINHHGKRTDAIVKDMLQHSRSSSGTKEPTEINKLADEYLRLSYQGLRAKDKAFNATMETNFDESIGKVNIIPQDIGRVLLNLYNNAFYAASLPSQGGFLDSDKSHTPTIWMSTKKVGDKVLISVKDNGNGIPQNAVDKIFQPFFTTKPTGQGTGLGLSLSYDIIKAHGGEIKVETEENNGSEFIITLHA